MDRQYITARMRTKAADFVVDLNTLSIWVYDDCQLFCLRKFWDQTVPQLQKVYLVFSTTE